MIIESASFKNLHGHLNTNLDFQPGVNILIGVNGSGKTSILNAMAWILSPASVQDGIPAAYLLSNTLFDEISITYTDSPDNKKRSVLARREGESVVIEISGIESILEIPIIDKTEIVRYRTARTIDEQTDLIARIMEDDRNNAVLRHLSELHGPLYLPLNRRWTEESNTSNRIRTRRSTTAGYLPITDVLALADRVFRQEQSEIFTLNENLRNSILTSLFEIESIPFSWRVWTMQLLEERQSRVVTALTNLGLNDARSLSERYFHNLKEVVSELSGQTLPRNFDFQNDPSSQMWVKWISEASPIASRMERLIPLIEQYESERGNITRRSTAFLSSINSFISDNGKELRFSQGFDLSVKLPNGQYIDGQNLSSGELQLLVLFTFLYFQFNSDQEFVVFVDEPELSLHLAWQQRYVNGVQEANPKAQFIIATHSPEIAGPAEDKVIDISPEVTFDAEI